MLFYIIAFILLLGPLVFVHEFGHFIFAKLFHVRVDVFSMGFGPKLLRKKWGETEYCVSIIPLGGYVKLYGQDPSEPITSELRHRALTHQDAWKRFLVFSAGPLFNFLFAIFVFALMLIIGEPHATPIIARVTPSSQAYMAGFRSGDFVTAVDRQVVTKFDDVAQIIMESPNKELTFRLKHKGQIKAVRAIPHLSPGYSIYGESVEIGEIDGLFNTGRYTVVGVSNPHSKAAKAGFKTGDEIVTINGNRIKDFEALTAWIDQALKEKQLKTFIFGIQPHDLNYWQQEHKTEPAKKATLEIKLPAQSLEQLGLYSSELFVLSVIKDSPAQKVGIAPGDRLIALDNETLPSFIDLKEQVQQSGQNKGSFELSFEHEGKIIKKEIIPLVSEKQFVMGVYPLFVQSEPDLFFERIYNPFTLTIEAWGRALDLAKKTLISVKKLFLRQVSFGTLGGPILIGKLAGDSMARGIAQFLKVMALISISLSIFNILPVPILDGGHVFLLFIEIIRGKPVSIKSTEIFQQIGLTLIVFLLVAVLFNDISKVGIPALKHIFQ